MNTPERRSDRVREAIDRYEQAHNPDQYDGAHDALLQAVAAEPDNPEVLIYAAMSSYYEQGERAKAVELLQHAIAVDPNRADCKCLLAAIGWAEMEWPLDKVLSLTQDAVRLEPDWVLPRAQLAFVYEDMGDTREADRQHRKVVELMQEHLASGRYSEYSYYEACVTGRHLRPGAVEEYLGRAADCRAGKKRLRRRS
jgi:tetratricopeptide (TPR) repeat protein